MVETDPHRDHIGIIVDTPLYCYRCQVRMKQLSAARWRCTSCGSEYEEK
ncbi:hypothetical protein HYV81_02355 [Candidatus Woesearchaeota archaeon]|nr:hypothetical protein [Candidatus Woesearchaeota archaeon]